MSSPLTEAGILKAEGQDVSTGLPPMLPSHNDKHAALAFLPASVAGCQISSWRPGASEHIELEPD